ncbi:DNA integrity scanning protein DisA [Microlunatus elymi]|uniref:DNA integrity scanning protein DisA n=1 Tax=Microlunatus elymi TaxID=2596828 RepID=A0A516Q4E2_9ACTN|nr:DNA integrity scanning diadenylate cyclase DisA [Microlunatus elymi]QDP98310.1 DNA integrity scanning protein DisA [Microlunatus elymi]
MASDPAHRNRELEYLALLAPGTPLRDGFERILRGRTGALVVLGNTAEVLALCTGGFELDVPYTPTSLRELSKMDGGIVMTSDLNRIVRAGVQFMPDPQLETLETGTRHRTADRVSRQTGIPVATVSASMSTIAFFLDGSRRPLETSDQIMSRANQAVQTMERYRERLWQNTSRLSALEVEDQVTIKDFALVAQRLEMIRRLELELSDYVIELGTDGRLLRLQLHELGAGLDDLRELLELDYRPQDDGATFGFAGLVDLTSARLLEPLEVARAIGFANQHLDTKISARGFRQLAQINRLPTAYSARLVEHFGNLQGVFGATTAELQQVEGVGESRARIIREGLTRLAESAYSEQLG